MLIIGAGPAGAVAALNLSPFHKVILADRRTKAHQRIGECLVPAARRLLGDMGILESFLREDFPPWFGNRTVWGSPKPEETDFLRDPDGHGWHLDRARFENWLRAIAVARGAIPLISSLEHIVCGSKKWRAQLATQNERITITANIVIDAGGRAAPVARKLGAHRQATDRLICHWLYGRDETKFGRGMTYLEGSEHGWWYSAPLPENRRVLAFHTDGDLLAPRIPRRSQPFLAKTEALLEIPKVLRSASFMPEHSVIAVAANSSVLEPCFGEGWLAIGDSALTFDPLSSQGLHNALFTGLAGAEATNRYLRGDEDALGGYSSIIGGIRDAYRRHLGLWYEKETRWSGSPFWQRRNSLPKEPEGIKFI